MASQRSFPLSVAFFFDIIIEYGKLSSLSSVHSVNYLILVSRNYFL
jgi:hypothetical protein